MSYGSVRVLCKTLIRCTIAICICLRTNYNDNSNNAIDKLKDNLKDL